MASQHRGTPRAGIGGITWVGDVSAARYLLMSGLMTALYLGAVAITGMTFRPVMVVGPFCGLAVGAALAQLHAARAGRTGGSSAVGRALSRTAMVAVFGAVVLLSRNLDENRAQLLFPVVCAASMGAAGYAWRRDGRLTRRAHPPPSVPRTG